LNGGRGGAGGRRGGGGVSQALPRMRARRFAAGAESNKGDDSGNGVAAVTAAGAGGTVSKKGVGQGGSCAAGVAGCGARGFSAVPEWGGGSGGGVKSNKGDGSGYGAGAGTAEGAGETTGADRTASSEEVGGGGACAAGGAGGGSDVTPSASGGCSGERSRASGYDSANGVAAGVTARLGVGRRRRPYGIRKVSCRRRRFRLRRRACE